MTITKYTFLSLNGNDFPVTSNSDGQLYQMLTGMKDGDYRIKDSTPPLNTALNRVYTNTSMVVGGRYFELKDHSITLKPAKTNFIHAVINIANIDDPVTITVEDANNSNTADVNNTSNILKVCFEIIATSGSDITNVTRTAQNTRLDELTVSGSAQIDGKITRKYSARTFDFGYGVKATAEREGEIVTLSIYGANTAGILPSTTTMSETIPLGWRPRSQYTFQVACSGTSYAVYTLGSDGKITYNGNQVPISNGFRATLRYNTNDAFVQ